MASRTKRLEEILEDPRLPTLPAVALKLLEASRDEDVGVREIAGLVELDPALAGKIVGTVNSSYYSLADPIRTAGRAVAYLGTAAVKSLILSLGLVDMTRKSGARLDLTDYWRRSLYSAAAARRIAAHVKDLDAEEAYTAALMQDIGVLALNATMESKYTWVQTMSKGNHHALPVVESAVIGFDHMVVGARLADSWGLSEELSASIRGHHDVLEGAGDAGRLAILVALAYRVYAVITGRASREQLQQAVAIAKKRLGLEPPELAAAISGAADDARRLSNLFGVDIGDPVGGEAAA